MRLLAYIAFVTVFAAQVFGQTSAAPGAFARMGFGARGIGMGNAMTAVTTGDISTFYNPAAGAFSESKVVAATFGVLSLDRTLNFISYTQSIKPTAGFSVGLINAGVRKIDGRDADGQHTEDYSTFEDQFYLAFSNKVDPRVSLGAAIKLYYSQLFDQVKSTTVGFDIGVLIQVTDDVSLGLAVQDINSKYKWDTKEIYPNPQARTTQDKFPNLRRLGLSYRFPSFPALVSAEVENSSLTTTVLRFGAEYQVVESFVIRGGLDRQEFGDDVTGAKPTFGFGLKNSFNGWMPSLNYTYVVEAFAPNGMHIITLSAAF